MEQKIGSKLREEYKIEKGCIFSPCLFNLYSEYIIWNAELDDLKAGIKIAGRNIINLRSTDDTILMAESEEQLKSLVLKVKEEYEKDGLIFNTQNSNIMASGPITSWEVDGETVETVADLIFLAPTSQQMVIAVMKFPYSLEGK